MKMNGKKRATVVISTALASLILVGSWGMVQAEDGGLTPAAQQLVLQDVGGHWAESAIKNAVTKGYVNGYEDGSFKPNNAITRAEFTKMLVSAMGLEIPVVEDGKWYEAFFKAASAAGITSTSEFNGNVNTSLTRAEMARLAVKATGEENTDMKKWMYLATKAGLMSGYGKGELGVDKTTTRAESITVIERILTVKKGGTLPADKYAVSQAEILWHKTNIFTVMPEFFGGMFDQPGFRWDSNNLSVVSSDGHYKGTLDALIAIDLADPNDPNLKELPSLDKVRWNNLMGTGGIPISSEYRNSYVLLYKTHVDYNTLPSKYGDLNYVIASLSGIKDPDIKAFRAGKLNSVARLFSDKGKDLNAFIFPKKGLKTNGEINIEILTPDFESKILISSAIPTEM